MTYVDLMRELPVLCCEDSDAAQAIRTGRDGDSTFEAITFDIMGSRDLPAEDLGALEGLPPID